MKNTSTLRTLFAAMALLLTFSFTFAGPGAAKAKNKLGTQIQRLVSNPDMEAELNGEAVVFFTVDEDKFVHVKGVFGTNDDLMDHIEESLKGKRVDVKGLEQGEEFQVKVKFTDLR